MQEDSRATSILARNMAAEGLGASAVTLAECVSFVPTSIVDAVIDGIESELGSEIDSALASVIPDEFAQHSLPSASAYNGQVDVHKWTSLLASTEFDGLA
eukprot:scaffold368634_cov37-Prasinocladus_malaysianus.AAC.1